jgi:hypothetical protein
MIELRINWVLPVPGEEVLMVPKGIPCKFFSSSFKQRNVQKVPCDVRHWSLCMTNIHSCMRTWRHARRSRIPAQVQYIELHCQKSIQAYYFWQNMMQLAWSNSQITLVNNSASSTWWVTMICKTETRVYYWHSSPHEDVTIRGDLQC